MTRKIVTVKFIPCGNSDNYEYTRVVVPTTDEYGYRFENEYAAKKELINKAVSKIYGRSCFWWDDNGLGVRYGQVMKSIRPTKKNSNPGNSAQTYRMRVEIEE